MADKKRKTTSSKNAKKLMVEMRNTSLDFGGGAGVFDLNFELPPGTILGLIGPSGCGKTTTIRLINGVLRPTAGEVHVFGKAPHAFSDEDRDKIGYIPQQFILYPNLSVRENMHFLGSIYGMPREERIASMERLLEFVELSEASDRLGAKLSGGMQRRLMLAGALMHHPDLLIADEPTAGIDPILRARIWENFRALRDEGKTMIVTTQYVGEAAFCDLVAVMRRGRLVIVDTPRALQRKAMGGEVIQIQIPQRRMKATHQFLEKQAMVQRVELKPNTEDMLFVFVNNAGKDLPNLLNLLRDKKNLTPTVAEPYLPSFDEVFVRLISQDEETEKEKVQ